ncbi:MAG TPA: methyltransferase domain-containing protein [Ktedonobacteraceae bacterium]|nr:methyltransferase domain-containing protein [Ktedonobacteraceae bacterium]
MSAPEKSSSGKSTYAIDAENAAEMARLMGQDRLLTKTMGGLLPPEADPSTMQTVLDIASGPGGWVLDIASAYPHISATGVDISHLMVAYAQSQAQVRGVDNAYFKVMNVLEPLGFAENTYDLVNVRFISAFMPVTAWPTLVQECMRILRPGGILRLTDFELPLSNSPAFEKLMGLATRSFQLSKLSFSPEGRNAGITFMLGRFLRDARFADIQHRAYVVEFSQGTENHMAMYQDWMIASKLVQPYMVKLGLAMQEELELLYQQMLAEMTEDDFCAVWYFMSAWGQKPKE